VAALSSVASSLQLKSCDTRTLRRSKEYIFFALISSLKLAAK